MLSPDNLDDRLFLPNNSELRQERILSNPSRINFDESVSLSKHAVFGEFLTLRCPKA